MTIRNLRVRKIKYEQDDITVLRNEIDTIVNDAKTEQTIGDYFTKNKTVKLVKLKHALSNIRENFPNNYIKNEFEKACNIIKDNENGNEE